MEGIPYCTEAYSVHECQKVGGWVRINSYCIQCFTLCNNDGAKHHLHWHNLTTVLNAFKILKRALVHTPYVVVTVLLIKGRSPHNYSIIARDFVSFM